MNAIDSKIQLIHGDAAEVLPTLLPVDLILTDPPYNVVNRSDNGLRALTKGQADAAPVDVRRFACLLNNATTGSMYVWCGTEQVSSWRRWFVYFGLSTRLCIWEKSNPSPMNGQYLWLSSIEACVFARKPKAPFFRRCKSPVWRGPTQRLKGFPCPKPVWLMKELVTASCPEGGTVLDPFMGSGSTGVACLETGRRFVGIEIDSDVYSLAKDRLEEAASGCD